MTRSNIVRSVSKAIKSAIYKKFITGNFTKAHLGREYKISPRTIGRIITEYIGITKKKAKDKVKDKVKGNFIKEDIRLKAYHLFTVSKMGKKKIASRLNLTLSVVEEIIKEMKEKNIDFKKPGELIANVKDIPLEEIKKNLTPPTYIITPQSITLASEDFNVVVEKEDERHADVLKAIFDENWDTVYDYVDALGMFKKQFTMFGDRVVVDNNGNVMIDNIPVNGLLVDKILATTEAGVDYTRYIKMLEKAFDNPSIKDVNDIYRFVNGNSIEIDEDGFIICYKSVYKDDSGTLLDSYTKTIINNVGSIVRMPREEVDHDSNITCSRGLHVADKYYFNAGFGDSVKIKCRVNPYNVVSVPYDYNDSKCRVCEYEVIGVVTE